FLLLLFGSVVCVGVLCYKPSSLPRGDRHETSVIQRHTGREAIATKLLLTVLAESGMIPLFGLLKNEKADRKSKKNS
ncbi:MAG: hypothetical protein ACOCN7_02880, partial [Prevotella sp.]